MVPTELFNFMRYRFKFLSDLSYWQIKSCVLRAENEREKNFSFYDYRILKPLNSFISTSIKGTANKFGHLF